MLKLLCYLGVIGFTVNSYGQDTQFSFGGSLNVEYENLDNYNFNNDVSDRNNDFMQITTLHLDAIKGENLAGRVKIRNINLWGDVQGFHGSEIAQRGETVRSNLFLLEEAYGVWKIDNDLTLQFGRGGFEMGKGEFVSIREEYYVPVTFDGALLMYDRDLFRLSTFGVKGVDQKPNRDFDSSTPAVADRGEAFFFGGMLTWKNLPEILTDASIHYSGAKSGQITSNQPTAIPKNDREWVGASLLGEVRNIDFRVMYNNFSGETQVGANTVKREGYMYDAEVGYNAPELFGLRVALYFHQDSGSSDQVAALTSKSKTYDPLYYNFDRYSGRMRLAHWGKGTLDTSGFTSTALQGYGLTTMAIRLQSEPSDTMRVTLDYFIFESTDAPNGIDKSIGSEIDLGVHKRYANGMRTSFEYGMFMPGQQTKNALGNDTASRIMLAAGFDF